MTAAEQRYKEIYSQAPMHTVFSPYRVCPLGAHVDHQKGIVTGFAFDMGIHLCFSPTLDGSVRLDSLNFEGTVEFSVLTPTQVRCGDWGDYARGVKLALSRRFVLRRGITGVVAGSLPTGGLSSSAAVLVAYVMALARANDIALTRQETVRIASEAEKDYIHLDNGILDHSCVTLGRRDSLLFLDTATGEYRNIRRNPAMPEFEIGIFFSGLTRSLVSSDYNLRVAECKTAAWNMLAFNGQPLKPLSETFLRDVPRDIYLSTRDRLPERFARRARHFYTEYRRVRQGVTAWETGNIRLLGDLIFSSCRSSVENYECGSPELVALYDAMRSTEGIYGGRFAGAGFKGACFALTDPSRRESIRRSMTERYLSAFPEYEGSFEIHFCRTDDGARFLEER